LLQHGNALIVCAEIETNDAAGAERRVGKAESIDSKQRDIAQPVPDCDKLTVSLLNHGSAPFQRGVADHAAIAESQIGRSVRFESGQKQPSRILRISIAQCANGDDPAVTLRSRAEIRRIVRLECEIERDASGCAKSRVQVTVGSGGSSGAGAQPEQDRGYAAVFAGGSCNVLRCKLPIETAVDVATRVGRNSLLRP
jgi:hypothetical protein